MKMRFTTRTLFFLVFAIALLLAGLFAIERGYRPDPTSEAFFVLGDKHAPQWSKCDPAPNKSGIQSEPLALEQNYRGSDNVKHRQKLFEYRYNDRFGNQTFDVTYDIDAHFDDDWNEYLFNPIVSGAVILGQTRTSRRCSTHRRNPSLLSFARDSDRQN
jgi:hypothetical protein